MRPIARLLPVQPHRIGDGPVETIAATKLHTYLEVGQDFSNWIKGRIARYACVEGTDFVTLGVSAKTGENLGERPGTEYHLTLDMAQELAMVERNEKGREARRSGCMARPKGVSEIDTPSAAAVPFVLRAPRSASSCATARRGSSWPMSAGCWASATRAMPLRGSTPMNAKSLIWQPSILWRSARPAAWRRGMNTTGTIINESGLYSTILTSRNEAARRFKKWVTGEVLPSIRRDGGYMLAAPEELAARALWA